MLILIIFIQGPGSGEILLQFIKARSTPISRSGCQIYLVFLSINRSWMEYQAGPEYFTRDYRDTGIVLTTKISIYLVYPLTPLPLKRLHNIVTLYKDCIDVVQCKVLPLVL